MNESRLNELDEEQYSQEQQYDYPYHYIPSTNGGFSQAQYWSWGYRYLGGIEVILDLLENISFDSLVDIGCGDGRFLREIDRTFQKKDLLGIDYSERAVRLANAMNPDIEYVVKNILEEDFSGNYQLATLLEVLEHIKPDELPAFVTAVKELLDPDGSVVITVPHRNKSLNEKHYQHFSQSMLEDLLGNRFSSVRYVPFDKDSKLLTLCNALLGGSGDNFVITNSWLNERFFQLYLKYYLYAPNETSCNRIAVVCEV